LLVSPVELSSPERQEVAATAWITGDISGELEG